MKEEGALRPTPELMQRLRDGKVQLHASMRQRSFKEKVRMVIDLQEFVLPILAKRGALRGYERVWPRDDEVD